MSASAKHSSSSVEHFSPADIVRAGRDVMGGLDVDPASCAIANKYIGAVRYYDKASNGFNRQWGGRVWLNAPGGLCDFQGREVLPEIKEGKTGRIKRASCTSSGECGLPPGHEHHGVTSSAKAWYWKLVDQYLAGNTQTAVFVAFSIELLQTTQVNAPSMKPLPLDFPVCYPRKRICFWVERRGELTPGNSPTHSSCLVFLPDAGAVRSSTARFVEVFSQFGKVVA